MFSIKVVMNLHVPISHRHWVPMPWRVVHGPVDLGRSTNVVNYSWKNAGNIRDTNQWFISVIPHIHGEHQWKYVELQDHDFSWEIGKFVNKDGFVVLAKNQRIVPIKNRTGHCGSAQIAAFPVQRSNSIWRNRTKLNSIPLCCSLAECTMS